jgi:tetratricopeptide (TPR) repeat protein
MNFSLTYALVLVLSIFPASYVDPAAADDKKARAYYQAATDALDSKRYSDALLAATMAEKELGGSNSRLLALRVKAYFGEGSYAKAKSELDQFYNSDPSDELSNEMGSYLIEIEKAIAAKNKAIIEKAKAAKKAKQRQIEEAKLKLQSASFQKLGQHIIQGPPDYTARPSGKTYTFDPKRDKWNDTQVSFLPTVGGKTGYVTLAYDMIGVSWEGSYCKVRIEWQVLPYVCREKFPGGGERGLISSNNYCYYSGGDKENVGTFFERKRGQVIWDFAGVDFSNAQLLLSESGDDRGSVIGITGTLSDNTETHIVGGHFYSPMPPDKDPPSVKQELLSLIRAHAKNCR